MTNGSYGINVEGSGAGIPSGTVTFLFTDIEGSTTIAQEHRDAWPSLLARHNAILQSAMEAHGGCVFLIVGDAYCVAFHTAGEAMDAALQAQRALQTEKWGETPIKVRMGIHTGAAHLEASLNGSPGYTGYSTLARTQRVMSAAYGGQILASNPSADLLLGELPEGVTLFDMKQHRLKGFLNPERLWQVLAPGLMQDFPALKTLDGIPNNLPIQLTSFIGREKEVAEIRSLVEHNRLVTLTGSGGVGKTRHSLQAAAELLDVFPDGVWFVELAPLSDPELVPHALGAALGVHEDEARPLMTALQDHLQPKHALVLLDNCEHLLEACAQLADALLRLCPHLHVLCSSREALGTAGEVSFRVPSLSLPDPRHLPALPSLTQYDSVRLFIERAIAVKSDFAVTNDNAPAVAQVCFRLDGIPLAIELAAARVKGLSVEQISQRLDDRFQLLTAGNRTALPRHQTLRAMIEWSYDLLTEPERVLLRRLAVFTGDWTLEAAEGVCAQPDPSTPPPAAPSILPPEAMDLLLRLVDKSLVVPEERGSQVRYHMLETIREFALDKLLNSGEEGSLRLRHLEFFLRFSKQSEQKLQGAERLIWLSQLGAEYANLQSALEWAQEMGSTQPAERLAQATEQLGDVQVLLGLGAKAMGLYQHALELRESAQGVGPAADVAACKWASVRLCRKIGETFLHMGASQILEQFESISQRSLEHGLSLIDGEAPHVESLRLLTTLANDRWHARTQQNWETAEHYALAAIAIGEQLDAPVELSAALGALDTVYGARGLYRERVKLAERRLALSHDPRFGDPRERVGLLSETGNALLFVGDYDEALPHLLEAERLAGQILDVNQQVYALGLQAQCFFSLDRWDEMLQIEARRQALEQQYGRERVDRMCFYCGLSANILALRGESDESTARRDEAYAMMTAYWGGTMEAWPPGGHY